MDKEISEKCSVRISKALSIRGMKQSELSEKTNIPKSAISQYVSGSFEPKQDRLFLIAQALNVDPVWLMGFDVPSTDYAYDFLQKMEDGSIRMDIKPNQAFVKDIDEITLKMTPEQMNNILQYAKFIKSSSEDKKDET